MVPSWASGDIYTASGLSAAFHDLQARLGSIHIAVTAVTELDLGAEVQAEMLTTAGAEAVRASSELAGVASIAACVLDDSDVGPCDAAALLTEAGDLARLTGMDAEVDAPGSAMVRGRERSLRHALTSLLRLAAGAGGGAQATLTVDERVIVRLTRRGGDADPMPAVASAIVDAAGGRTEAAGDGEFAFSMERAT